MNSHYATCSLFLHLMLQVYLFLYCYIFLIFAAIRANVAPFCCHSSAQEQKKRVEANGSR